MNISVPSGSMCTIGFSERRPSSLAVGSPSLYATNPCASSCSVSDRMKIGMRYRKTSRSVLTSLLECDALDLHRRAGGQLRDLDGGPRRRRVADERGVGVVHGGEVAQVGQEHRRL